MKSIIVKVLASFAAIVVAGGCATETPTKVVSSGDPIDDARIALRKAPPRDQVLWQYRIAAMDMRAGRYDDAKAMLDQALARINGIMGPDKDAAAARSMFKAESKKTFIGEPYERVMANFYRGCLYWRDGEPDNARACFVNAQFQDSDAALAFGNEDDKKKDTKEKEEMVEAEKFACDYFLLDYLDGWTKTEMKGDGSDAFKRAEALAKGRAVPPFDPNARVIVFAEFGNGPTKFATGSHNEELRIKPGISTATTARLKVNQQVVELPAYDDINFQATTRGGRVMDHVLHNKAVFKSTTSSVGDAALVAGAATATASAFSGSSAGGYAGLGMMFAGLVAKGISAAANPAADIRSWDNLPGNISFAAISLPVGEHSATVEFLDADNNPVLTKPIVIQVADANRDTVVFVSDKAIQAPDANRATVVLVSDKAK